MKLPINKIICGDCLEIMKDWPDNCVDLVLTDPPYEFLSKSPVGGGIMTKENSKQLERIDKMFGMSYEPSKYLALCKQICRPFNGYFFTNKTLLTAYIKFAEENNYKWDILIWNKTSVIPLNNNHYLIDKEYIVFIKEVGAIFNSDLGYRHYFTVKRKPTETKRTGHPAEKPLFLFPDLISISSNKGSVIFDGYCGSGTTCVAAKMLGRRYIGIDISEKYCEISRKRIKGIRPNIFEKPKKITRANFGLNIKSKRKKK